MTKTFSCRKINMRKMKSMQRQWMRDQITIDGERAPKAFARGLWAKWEPYSARMFLAGCSRDFVYMLTKGIKHKMLLYRYIDQGKNPQLYTKDCMEKALARNEAVKGKIDALKVITILLQHIQRLAADFISMTKKWNNFQPRFKVELKFSEF